MARFTLASCVCLSSCLLVACSGGKPGGSGDCTAISDCAPGEACVDDRCVTLCVSDRSCPDGQICQGDYCIPGARNDRPVVHSIDADGIADTTAGHAPHRIRTTLTILGEHLEGAGAQLVGQATTRDLEVCETSADRLAVLLPSDLTPGVTYSLRVANQAGACDAALPTLQGEQGPVGPAGSPDTGADIVSKINASTGTISASRIAPVDAATLAGQHAADFADAAHAHAEHPLRAELPLLNLNPGFAAGIAGWTIDRGAGAVVADTTATSGSAFANTANSVAWIYGSEINVDHTRTYIVRAKLRNTTPGNSDGRVFLAVRLTDAAGQVITGDGVWWFYPASQADAALDTWQSYTGSFGAYTKRTFPPTAARMTVGAILNYHQTTGNTPPGNRIFNVTDLSIEAYEGPDHRMRERIERYNAVCAAFGVTGGYVMVAAVTPGDSTVNMTGDSVCANYRGNNNLTSWGCAAVPYVYANTLTTTPSNGNYMGTDIRPTWSACATTRGPTGGYPWVDPVRNTGVMMACCYHN